MNYGVKLFVKRNVILSSSRTSKKIIAGFFMALFYLQMWAADQPQFTEGAELFVIVNSGLTLRAQPDAKSVSLGVLEYGTSITVLNQPDSLSTFQTINWVKGRWLFVDFDGIHGYMFDGYLSDLPLPTFEFEKCQLDMDLIYPLESWADINLGESNSDTITAGALYKVTDFFETGDRLIKTQVDQKYKIELFLTEVRLMDTYHLLISMLDGYQSINTFKEVSTFIEDREGELYKVRIDLDYPVILRKLKNGDIKITISSQNYICGI